MGKMKNLLFLILWVTAFSCTQKNYTNPHVIIESGYGDIEVELYPEKAPKTVAAFLKNIDEGLYKKSSFYRVIKNDNVPEAYNTGLIQGGIYQTHPQKINKIQPIPHESPRQTVLSHVSGTLSMARTTPGSATSEFFICIGDQKQFDSSSRGNSDGMGYAAFGKVFKGMDVVSKIQNRKSNGEDFHIPVNIKNIKRL
jgi:peptidyl-prolyl cis-trans isomerase A (cyclophilin A)